MQKKWCCSRRMKRRSAEGPDGEKDASASGPGSGGRYCRLACVLVLALTGLCSRGYAANVVLIRAAEGQAETPRGLVVASQFYGLDLRVVPVGAPEEGITLNGLVDRTTVAVAIQARALSKVNREMLFRSLHRNANGSTPLLILGITPETEVELLRDWSGGAVMECRRMEARGRLAYHIDRAGGVTRELSDVTLPIAANGADYLSLATAKQSETQIVGAVEASGQVSPVFVETAVGQTAVFLASRLDAGSEDFAVIAPAMLFTKYCAGERGWHALHHYANLTIDDPWLREPYGFVDYAGLLREMEKHRFHATIAFIPWNYDRSQPEVIALFREHPDKLSIAIHGDNHDHKEFTDYRAKPFAGQMANLKQSLARMDRFRKLTAIPYARVMIFPHSIAPEQTLTALKENGYWATVNSSNVPMGAVPPADPLFYLRAATLDYGGSLSLRRYSVEGTLAPEFAPVNLFLDNPLLFYCHQEFFSSGIGAFDAQADAANQIDPGIRWRSLGDIVRHMYLVKRRDDGDIDVLSFTPEMSLENSAGRNAVFHVRKEETERPRAVRVDGQPWPYSLEGGHLEMRIAVASGETRAVSITYDAGDFGATDIERRSARVYLLRMASDFRDIGLARFAPGLWFIRLYQQHGEPLALVSAGGLTAFVFLLAAFWRMRVMLKSRRRASKPMVTY